MACCRNAKKFAQQLMGKSRIEAAMRARAAASPKNNTSMIEGFGPEVRETVKTDLCKRVEELDTDLAISYHNGILLVKFGTVGFELFSALRSQHCEPEWAEPLKLAWGNLRRPIRDEVVARFGQNLKVSDLLSALSVSVD